MSLVANGLCSSFPNPCSNVHNLPPGSPLLRPVLSDAVDTSDAESLLRDAGPGRRGAPQSRHAVAAEIAAAVGGTALGRTGRVLIPPQPQVGGAPAAAAQEAAAPAPMPALSLDAEGEHAASSAHVVIAPPAEHGKGSGRSSAQSVRGMNVTQIASIVSDPAEAQKHMHEAAARRVKPRLPRLSSLE